MAKIKKHHSITLNEDEIAKLIVMVGIELENKMSKTLTEIWRKLL